MKKAQLGSIVKAAKVAKVAGEAADAAKLAKRAAAAKKAQQAEELRIAFQRMERNALKDKLKAADKAAKPKKQKGGDVSPYTPSNQPGGKPKPGGAILENRTSVPKMPKMGEMTPKEKRQQKREMKSTLKYVKKHGSGLAMKKGGSIKKK